MKKVLAIVLAIVMTLSLSTVSFAAESKEANDALETINTGTLFIQKVIESIHLVIHGFSRVFEADCPMCNVDDATPEDFADVLANAEKGEVVSLDAGDYGVITLGTLDGIGITAKDGAIVDYIVIPADASLKDVTLSGFELEVEASGEYCIKIDANATIENLVIEDVIFTGPATVKNCYGINGHNNTATMTVRNCTFIDTGYAMYSSGKLGYAELTVEDCTFINIYSWVIHLQYGFLGNMTITGCTFAECEDGIAKHGSFAEDKTFTFTNNTVGADCYGHDGVDSKWFEIKTNNAVIEGNTYGGAEWIPGADQGIKAL